MEITEVRIKLMEGAQDRLLGFCSITFDQAFVIRDLKIIKGSKGAFVAMPSRKLTDRCPGCGCKNHLRAAYCSQCGESLGEDRSIKSPDGRAKLYADIAHPINSDCRDQIQQSVLEAYDEELLLAERPDYVCRYDEFGEFDIDDDSDRSWDESPRLVDNFRLRRWDSPNETVAPSPHSGHAKIELKTAQIAEEFGDGLF